STHHPLPPSHLTLLPRRADLALIGLLGFAIAMLTRFDGRGELGLLTVDQIFAPVGQIADRLFSAVSQISSAFDAGLVIVARAFTEVASGVASVIEPLARRVGEVRTKLASRLRGEEQCGDRADAGADQKVDQFIAAAAALIFCHDFVLLERSSTGLETPQRKFSASRCSLRVNVLINTDD